MGLPIYFMFELDSTQLCMVHRRWSDCFASIDKYIRNPYNFNRIFIHLKHRIIQIRMFDMQMVLQIVLLLLGFVALIKGADIFVDGSSSIAALLKVPSVIIGLTIVAMGTSAPELAVSTSAALKGSNEIAVSNVVGSNLFNLLIVLGVCAVIRPVPIERVIRKRDYPILIVVTVALFAALTVMMIGKVDLKAAAMNDNVSIVSRVIGIALLVGFIGYIVYLIINARKSGDAGEPVKTMSPLKSVIFIVLGIALIIAGGQFVVNSAKYIAAALGMSETLIGLTVVALGTSLPELVTSVVASRKGENGLAVGNVVGSNLFNLMLILGVSATLNPIPVNFASMIDFAILVVATVIVYIFAMTKNINRFEGIAMIALYAATMVFAVLR